MLPRENRPDREPETELRELRARVVELEETLRAIRSGEVDAVVFATPEGDRAFTLQSADTPYRSIVESMGEGAATLTDSGIILYANQRLAQMLKTSLHRLVGSTLYECVAAHERGPLRELLAKGLSEPVRAELRLLDTGGLSVPVSIAVSPLVINDEPGLNVVVADLTEQKNAEAALQAAYEEMEVRVEERTADLKITAETLREEIADRRAAEEALRESEERLSLALEGGEMGMWRWDFRTDRVVWNAREFELLGLTPDNGSLNTDLFFNCVHEDDLAGLKQAVEEAIVSGGALNADFRIVRKDGEVRWLTGKGRVITDEEGRPVEMTGVNFDITGRKRLEETIRHQAYHDALTGLANRLLFVDHLNLELTQARRQGSKLAVLFLDLDRFKAINDTLGHQLGDRLLQEAALRLRGCTRESDTIARFGGDEFAVLLPNITHAEDAAVIAEKIIATIQEPFLLGSQESHVTASVGISMYPGDGDYSEQLLKHADIAMYHAKGQGRNNFQFYNAAMNIRTLERMILENSLRQTLKRGELELFYQPQVDIKTGRLICAEALVRWRHPEQGLLAPRHFIPLAEETGFIVPLDEWVLRTACAQFKAWQEAGLPLLCVTVNISARQFQQPHFSDMVTEVLKDTGLDPRFLELEITENIAMRDIERTIPQLHRLTERGIGFSIDDFGSGYSSLGHLKNLPVRRMKIDKSFVRGIIVGSDDRAIVRALVGLAHSLNMRVVAEGVETEEQLAFLDTTGCDEAQGFWVSEPLAPESFERYLATPHPRPAAG